MAADRVIKCKNQDGITMTFTEKGFDPFLLVKATGIYDSANTVSVTNNTMIDGGVFQGSVATPKNIVLVLKDLEDYDSNREKLDILFSSGELGVLTVFDGKHERQIEYYVESVTSTATVVPRLTTVSLICPNPFFYDTYDHMVSISDMMASFEWEHNFLEGGEEFSYYNEDRIKTIANNTAENNIGLMIQFTCTGSVTNPSITKVQTNEVLKVGYTGKTFTLVPGDVLLFNTTTGSKGVWWTHNGTTTLVNEYLTDSSSFFQLTRGENTFGYDAESNPEYVTVKMVYRYKYARA